MHRWVAASLGALSLLVGVSLIAVPAASAAGTYGVDDYPDAGAVCTATGKVSGACAGYDWSGMSSRRFYKRNCTDFVAWRLGITWGSLAFPGGDGNARGWKQGAINSGYQTSTTPIVGAVAWWGSSTGGGFGHVAVVTAVNSDGSARVEEYNQNTMGTYANGRDVRAEAYLYIGVSPTQPPPTPPPALPPRIGVIDTTGRFSAKEGGLYAGWVFEAEGIKQIVMSGSRVGVLDTSGRFSVKEGDLFSGWTLMADGIKQIAMSGNRVGVLNTNGFFSAKEGDLRSGWIDMASGINEIAMSGNRIGVVNTNGLFSAKEGDLRSGWVDMAGGIKQIAMSGNRVGVLNTNGLFSAKEGDLRSGWIDLAGGITQGVLAGNRVGVLNTNGLFSVKEGSIYSGWVDEAGGIQRAVLSV